MPRVLGGALPLKGEKEMMRFQKTIGSAYWLFLAAACLGQASAQTSPLILLQTIPVPNWTNTGATQANLDIFAFNPWTHVLYVADRVNHAVTAVDTITNGVIGVLPIPSGGSTNGVLVAIDLQKLVVTDGKNNVFVYDLRVPGVAPEAYALPGVTAGTDESIAHRNPLFAPARIVDGLPLVAR